MKIPENGPPRNVLIAEDDPNDRMLLARAAREMGESMRFHFVRDGEELINYLSGTDVFADRVSFPLPDLVLLDLHLPKLSGINALQWIREQPSFVRLKVFAWSGSESSSEFALVKAAGADRAMARPRDYDELRALLRSFVGIPCDRAQD